MKRTVETVTNFEVALVENFKKNTSNKYIITGNLKTGWETIGYTAIPIIPIQKVHQLNFGNLDMHKIISNRADNPKAIMYKYYIIYDEAICLIPSKTLKIHICKSEVLDKESKSYIASKYNLASDWDDDKDGCELTYDNIKTILDNSLSDSDFVESVKDKDSCVMNIVQADIQRYESYYRRASSFSANISIKVNDINTGISVNNIIEMINNFAKNPESFEKKFQEETDKLNVSHGDDKLSIKDLSNLISKMDIEDKPKNATNNVADKKSLSTTTNNSTAQEPTPTIQDLAYSLNVKSSSIVNYLIDNNFIPYENNVDMIDTNYITLTALEVSKIANHFCICR